MTIPILDLSAMHRELEGELNDAWRQVTCSAKFIGGEFVERFESDWASYCQTLHCVGVSSGTTALQLALMASGIGSGDEVIVPANTFFGTVDAVLAVNAVPIFVDVDPTTLLMTASAVRSAITPRTAAVMVVHLYGQPADMDAINHVASAAGLLVIEDAAQAHGSTWRGKRAGSLSHIGCFSFYPGKNLGAYGDAGAVVTNDKLLADKVRSLGNYGRTSGERYRHDEIGGNHRLDGLQAAILSVKLQKLDAWNAIRRQAFAWYENYLSGLPITTLREAADARSNYHLAVIQTDCRNRLRQLLMARGIETAIHYPIPCHKQPALANTRQDRHPVTENAAERILSLPMGPHVTQAHVREVADAIAEAFQDSRSLQKEFA